MLVEVGEDERGDCLAADPAPRGRGDGLLDQRRDVEALVGGRPMRSVLPPSCQWLGDPRYLRRVVARAETGGPPSAA